ncbi:MAG: hypothetical protein AB1509_18435 [Chloroflexota bacterium]
MSKKILFLLFWIGGTAFLFPSLYRDQWKVVEPGYYRIWEQTYERVVVARLAKSRQDGIFSAGGLLGLANSSGGWNFDLDPQYEIYTSGSRVEDYLPYKSHPGAQGVILSAFALITNLPPQHILTFMRLSTTLLSALTLSLFAAWLAVHVGWLSAVLVLLFCAASEWFILPASNSYWSLWAFYVPALTAIALLANASKRNIFPARKIYFILFAAVFLKVLFTGFELITAVLVMTTVPFIYFAIVDKWTWRTLTARVFKAGLAMTAAVLAGAIILAAQIAINDGSIRSSVNYIVSTLGRRSSLNTGKYNTKTYKESKEANLNDVLSIYLNTNAFNTQTPPQVWQVPYWKLIALFGVFTGIFLVKHKIWKPESFPAGGLALMASTWYSILAPLSWYVIFKPTAYDHPFLFPMGWQMPFTLLGLALCGYVMTDLFKRRDV